MNCGIGEKRGCGKGLGLKNEFCNGFLYCPALACLKKTILGNFTVSVIL